MKSTKELLTLNRTLIMGVLNVTPDSFSDGGEFINKEEAVARAKEMIRQGADIIDVGGQSTRPGASEISAQEELDRVLDLVSTLCSEGITVSIDSYKPFVVSACIKAGVDLVNDITGLSNKEMVKVVSQSSAGVVLMHMQGSPQNMQDSPHYNDVVSDIKTFFSERISAAKTAGISQIILDPGIGFGKTLEHNLEILRRLEEFNDLGCPLLVGTSRKSFIGKITGQQATDRLEGTLATNALAIMKGARIIRVHDIKECKAMALVMDAITFPNAT